MVGETVVGRAGDCTTLRCRLSTTVEEGGVETMVEGECSVVLVVLVFDVGVVVVAVDGDILLYLPETRFIRRQYSG